MDNNVIKKYNIWINVLAFIMMIIALIYFVVLPMKQGIFDNADNLRKKKIDNEIDLGRISKIPEMEKVHNVISEKRRDFDIVFDKNKEIELIEKLESLATETGNEISLQMEYVSPDDKNNKVAANGVSNKKDEIEKIEVFNINRLVAHINLSGRYDQLFNFLNKLENIGYIVNVTALDLKKEIAEKDKQSLDGSVDNSSIVTNAIVEEVGKNEKDVLKSKIDAVIYLKN